MAVILILFFNKITTPRYLSNVELKINGLILLTEPKTIPVSVGTLNLGNSSGKSQSGLQWVLIANSADQEEMLKSFSTNLKKKIQKKTQIISADSTIKPALSKALKNYPATIAIVNPQQQLIAYFKPPFDKNKMLLTYSSVFTHR